MAGRYDLPGINRNTVGGWGNKASYTRDDGLKEGLNDRFREKQFFNNNSRNSFTEPKKETKNADILELIYNDGQHYSKERGRPGYNAYHEPLNGDSDDEYLYTKTSTNSRRLSSTSGDGLSPEVKQLMNSLGLSKSDMEELSRLPDRELSVNNLMHAIGDLRRRKGYTSPSRSGTGRKSFSPQDQYSHSSSKQNLRDEYYNPEEPTDYHDKYSPHRSPSPVNRNRLSDAFSNFQQKWYENSSKKAKAQDNNSWKDDDYPSRKPQPKETDYRDISRPRPRSRNEYDQEREFYGQPEPRAMLTKPDVRVVVNHERKPQPTIVRGSKGPVVKNKPSRWENPLPKHPAPLENMPKSAGLLGNPLNPNTRGLEKLAANVKIRDDGLNDYANQQLRQNHRDFMPKQRIRDDGLDDYPVPPKRRSLDKFSAKKMPNNPRLQNFNMGMLNVQAPASLLPTIPDQQNNAVLAAQMKAMQVLKSEALMKAGLNHDSGKNKKLPIKSFSTEEALQEAKEMRNHQGRVLYLRYKSEQINQEDIIKLAQPFDKVTNILIVKPSGPNHVWYQAFLELAESDCAAAMLEHYMPNPPKVQGVYMQVQRSKYQTLKLREDQMGRDMNEMMNRKPKRKSRYSISPLRASSKDNKSKEVDKSKNDTNGNKRSHTRSRSKEKLSEKNENESTNKVKKSEIKKKSDKKNTENTKSSKGENVPKSEKGLKEQAKSENVTNSKIATDIKKSENENGDHNTENNKNKPKALPKEKTQFENIEAALNNAEKLAKLVKEEEHCKLTSWIIASLKLAIKQ